MPANLVPLDSIAITRNIRWMTRITFSHSFVIFCDLFLTEFVFVFKHLHPMFFPQSETPSFAPIQSNITIPFIILKPICRKSRKKYGRGRSLWSVRHNTHVFILARATANSRTSAGRGEIPPMPLQIKPRPGTRLPNRISFSVHRLKIFHQNRLQVRIISVFNIHEARKAMRRILD